MNYNYGYMVESGFSFSDRDMYRQIDTKYIKPCLLRENKVRWWTYVLKGLSYEHLVLSYYFLQIANAMKTVVQGRNWVILRGGRRYIYSRKDEIIYGLCPSVKCVASLFGDMYLARYEMQEGARAPSAPQLRPCCSIFE